MTRQIDESVPLSDADRAFLLQNGQENRVRALDDAHGVTTTPPFLTGDEPSRDVGVPMGTINAPGLSPAQIAANVGGSNPHVALASAPTDLLEAELSRRRGGPSLPDSEAETVDGDYATTLVEESEDYPYEAWTVAQLKAQLGYRELSKSGNKDELANRLRDNDSE